MQCTVCCVRLSHTVGSCVPTTQLTQQSLLLLHPVALAAHASVKAQSKKKQNHTVWPGALEASQIPPEACIRQARVSDLQSAHSYRGSRRGEGSLQPMSQQQFPGVASGVKQASNHLFFFFFFFFLGGYGLLHMAWAASASRTVVQNHKESYRLNGSRKQKMTNYDQMQPAGRAARSVKGNI